MIPIPGPSSSSDNSVQKGASYMLKVGSSSSNIKAVTTWREERLLESLAHLSERLFDGNGFMAMLLQKHLISS